MAVNSIDVRAVSLANAAIRRSFDTSPRTARQVEPADMHRQYLAFEAARYKFEQARRGTGRGTQDDGDNILLFSSFADELADVLKDPSFEQVTSKLLYRLVPSVRDAVPAELSPLFEREDHVVTVFSAVLILREFMLDRLADEAISGDRALINVLPEQKIAPLRFDVTDGRLVLQHHASAPSEAGASIVSVAKEELVTRGRDVVRQLEQSNCDRRLVGAFRDLQERLENSENVIGIGLSNLGCEVMYKAFENELPDAIAATLQVHTVGVGMFLAQYPEWLQFSQAATSSPLDRNAEEAVVSALDSAIAATEGSPELADPEVPQTLKQLREIVLDPKRASKRAVFAAIRSMENLIIKVFSYGSDFLHETITKTSSAASTSMARAVAASLLLVGLSAASNLLPASNSVEGLGWLREAVAVVQREMVNIPK